MTRPVAHVWLLAALLLAAPDAAAPASFTGSLTLYVFGTQQAMPAVVFGDGVGTTGDALVALGADAFAGTATATTPVSAAPPITGNRLVLEGHAAGAFSGSPLAGAMPLRGRLSLTGLGGAELLRIPLSVAGASGATATWESPGGGGALTAVGAPWSAGLVVANVPTSTGVRSSSFAGYDHRVAGVGTLQLVTPILVHSTLAGDFLLWSALRATFAPEPSRALLLAAGALALAAAGRRRRAGAR
jgi:hypothetical protein